MTRAEAVNLVAFDHSCTCGATYRQERNNVVSHQAYCPQKDEYDAWVIAMGGTARPWWAEYDRRRDAAS